MSFTQKCKEDILLIGGQSLYDTLVGMKNKRMIRAEILSNYSHNSFEEKGINALSNVLKELSFYPHEKDEYYYYCEVKNS